MLLYFCFSLLFIMFFFFFFKQKTAYEMRISDWSSDVCSSDLPPFLLVSDIGYCIEVYADFSGTGKSYAQFPDRSRYRVMLDDLRDEDEIGRASCRDRVCPYV